MVFICGTPGPGGSSRISNLSDEAGRECSARGGPDPGGQLRKYHVRVRQGLLGTAQTSENHRRGSGYCSRRRYAGENGKGRACTGDVSTQFPRQAAKLIFYFLSFEVRKKVLPEVRKVVACQKCIAKLIGFYSVTYENSH